MDQLHLKHNKFCLQKVSSFFPTFFVMQEVLLSAILSGWKI